MNSFDTVSCAEATIGRGDKAFEIYRKICPAYLEDISEIHRTEPYVYSQMIAGKDAKFHGEAKNAWLTGTAAWTYVTITQAILGVKPHYDGLMIDPCIPTSWSQYTVTRRFRGTTYRIIIKNPEQKSKGVSKIIVNGEEMKGCILPVISSKKDVYVEVTM